MSEPFTYSQVPKGYLHCFNAACPRTDKCMRYIVASHATGEHPTLHVVNPQAYPEDASTCPHFAVCRKIKLAWGIKRIYDRLPLVTAGSIRLRVVSLFSKGTYYRLYHGERPLWPEEQQQIADIYAAFGQPAPAYERYTYELRW